MSEFTKRARAASISMQVQPVSMHVAASLAYHQVMGHFGAAESLEQQEGVLNDAATALSHVGDVYYETEDHRLLRIPDDELMHGAFGEGARSFKTADGPVYRKLSMRRGDVMNAIVILKKAPRVDLAGTPRKPAATT